MVNNTFPCMSSVTFSNWGMQLEDWPMNIWRTDRSTLNPNISGWFSFPQRKGTTSRSTLPCCYTTQACRHSHRQSWYYQLPQDTDLFASTFRNFGCLLYVSESAMGVASNFSTKQYGTLWGIVEAPQEGTSCRRKWQGRADEMMSQRHCKVQCTA